MVLKADPPAIQYSAHGSKQYGTFIHTLRRQTSTFTQQNCALMLNHDVYIPSIHTHITYQLRTLIKWLYLFLFYYTL